jgi:hypothetical protein
VLPGNAASKGVALARHARAHEPHGRVAQQRERLGGRIRTRSIGATIGAASTRTAPRVSARKKPA